MTIPFLYLLIRKVIAYPFFPETPNPSEQFLFPTRCYFQSKPFKASRIKQPGVLAETPDERPNLLVALAKHSSFRPAVLAELLGPGRFYLKYGGQGRLGWSSLPKTRAAIPKMATVLVQSGQNSLSQTLPPKA